MREEPIEIVKRIPTPNEDPTKLHEDEIIFEEHLRYEKRHQKSNNKIILAIFGLSVTTLIGFYGFNFLEKNNNETIVDISTSPITNTETIDKKETLATQAIAQTPMAIEKSKETPKENIKKNPTKPIEAISSPADSTHYTEALALPTLENENSVTNNTTTKIPKPQTVIIKEEIIEEPVVIETIEKPILVAKNPLNIIEIVHEKPMTIEEYDAQEKVKEEAQVVAYIAPKQKQTIHYEKIKPYYYTIRKKDTLATIAKKFYGNSLEYKKIIHANKRLRSAKTSLHLGEKICIPRKDGKKTRRFIIVEKGNTLALLAKRFYGDKTKIKKIIRANYKIKNSRSMLHIGQKVYLPN